MASAAKRFFSGDNIFLLLLPATSFEHHSVLSEPALGEGLGTINALVFNDGSGRIVADSDIGPVVRGY
jgi:hypothetical protein